MGPHDLVHAHGEREVVRRILEQRIPADVHLVEEDARQEHRQAERLLVGDEMDLVPARGERDAELGRHGAGAAVRRIAGDADPHVALPSRHHALGQVERTRVRRVDMRVTRSGGSWCRNQVRCRFAYCRVSMMTRAQHCLASQARRARAPARVGTPSRSTRARRREPSARAREPPLPSPPQHRGRAVLDPLASAAAADRRQDSARECAGARALSRCSR